MVRDEVDSDGEGHQNLLTGGVETEGLDGDAAANFRELRACGRAVGSLLGKDINCSYRG